MIKSVVQFSLHQKVFFNLVFFLLTVAGFFSITQIPTERYPNINFGEVNITTVYPGASPVEVETLVTKKIEDTLEKVEKIEWITATSYPERSHIRIKFQDNSDFDFLFSELRLNVLNMMSELPEDVDPPVMENVIVSEILPVVAVNVGGPHNNRTLTLMAKKIKTALQGIAEIKRVKLEGEYIREFHINLDPDKLRLYGISFDQVSSSLQNANISVPAGSFRNNKGDYLIKVDEKFSNRDQVLKTIIRRDGDGSFIRLENVITHIEPNHRDPVTITTVNGENVVTLKIVKTVQGDALKIKGQIEAVLESMQPWLEKENLQVTLTHDSTTKISDGVSTLSLNMLSGMFLVALVVWYFMGFRNAGLITIGIPFSFLTTMIFMHLTGNSLNELTLFSFVLVTGIIVDDAIVVCENIYRHIQNDEPVYDAVIEGVSEVALPVIASTLTSIAAFLPMLVMSGSTGEFFALIPIAVTFALISSLVECLIMLPIHYPDFGPTYDQKLSKHLQKDNFIIVFCRNLTASVLKITLRHRWKSLISIVLLLLISFAILGVSISGKIPLIRIKFFPDDYNIYYVDIKGPAETPIEQINEKVKQISRFIHAQGPGYSQSAAGSAGFYINEDYEPVFGNNYGNVMVALPAKDDREFDDPMQHLENMRTDIQQQFQRNGYTLSLHAQKDGPPTGKDITIRIVGSDFLNVSKIADLLYKKLQTDEQIAPHLIGLEDNRGEAKRIYRFEIQHERVHEYDLNSSSATQLAGALLDGRYIGKYRMQDEEVDLKIRIDPESIDSPQDVLFIPFIEHATGPVRLGDIAKLRTYKEQSELHRYQNQRAITIKANIKPGAPTSTPAVIANIENYYADLQPYYPGATVAFGGEHEDTQKSYISLSYAFIIAVLIMYIILATQFQSYVQPFIILSAIVFALIGVIFGKLFSQSLFTVNSFIAVIGVAGIVVNDSLLLIDFMNQHFQKTLNRAEAIHYAIETRLRPIILTTLTTTMGLLPMAIGIPDYSLTWGSMASTFVTGLAAATFLTLFIVPVLWDITIEWRHKKNGPVKFMKK